MQVEISFKGMEKEPSLKQKAIEKFQSLSNYLDPDSRVSITFWEYDKKKVSDVKIHSKQDVFLAKAHSDNFFKTIELLKDKAKFQILKNKNK